MNASPTSPFWSALDRCGGAALRADWQRACAGDFDKLAPFLRPSTESSGHYPCPGTPACGCRHEVRETDDGLFAVCTCEDCDCEPVGLFSADTIVQVLDRPALGEAIRQALGCTAPQPRAQPGSHPSWEIGFEPVLPGAVHLLLPRDRQSLWREVERLTAILAAPFLLLTPKASCFSPDTDAALKRAGGAILPLESLLQAEPGGGFRQLQPFGRLAAALGQHLAVPSESAAGLRGLRSEVAAMRKELGETHRPPEEIPEDDARRVFALVKTMESESVRTAPVLTVFRLYCMEALSAEQIARKCHCSKATIINRLRTIRRRTGASPDKLRTYSAQFERIENSLADPRARRISRRELVDEEVGEEDGEYR